jgi:host cell surface-exposed lipoprotein
MTLTTPAPSSAPASPSMTVAGQQAVNSAQEYLDMGQGFSESGLLQQLTSSAGDGDTKSDAEFAIEYLHPDWDQQAIESAKNYLKMGGFSKSSLYQQLTSSYGEGFSPPQADYALSKVGL